MTDKKLAVELENWFITHIYCKNKWNRATGKVIYKYLNQFKNWKNAPRGKPFNKRGYY